MAGEDSDSLDLSHLTEDEQDAILKVLMRDSELRSLDESRVRKLEEIESDPVRLRSLSGSWFREERSKRHRDCKQGCDLVHASIRRRKSKGKDVSLTGLFNGHTKDPPPTTNPSSEVEKRLGEGKEEEREGLQESVPPTPTPRTRSEQSQLLQDKNGVSSSTECVNRSNCTKQVAEEDSDGHDGDAESLSSGVTEPDLATLKSSSSVSSLHSSYMLSGSMMSLFSSGEFDAVEVKGRIQFSLVYDKQREELKVRVCRCEDLAPAHKSRSDPYVKTYLLPDKSSHSKKKTSVRKKTLNPVYDQSLRYKLNIDELRGRTLNVSVWHAEPLGRNVFLGEVEVSLEAWDWASTQALWYQLQPRVQMSSDAISSRGTIVLSVKFIPEGSEGAGLPPTGELHIWLREAQGLLSTKRGLIDSFVKSYILPDASRQSGQKTRVVKRSISPTYNHTMVYDGFHTTDLQEACAELTVWQRDGLKSLPLGGVRLSPGTGQSYGEAISWMDSTTEEVTVWTSMIQCPNQWIDTTLPIRTNLTHRPH